MGLYFQNKNKRSTVIHYKSKWWAHTSQLNLIVFHTNNIGL